MVDFDPAAVRAALGLTGRDPAMPVADLAEAHGRFVRAAHALSIPLRERRVLAVWLESSVDREIAAAWNTSPERALWLHGLAQCVCMELVSRFAPAAAGHGCAPVPPAEAGLVSILNRAGCPCRLNPPQPVPVFSLGYVTVTDTASRGCGDCALHASCPGPSGPPGARP